MHQSVGSTRERERSWGVMIGWVHQVGRDGGPPATAARFYFHAPAAHARHYTGPTPTGPIHTRAARRPALLHTYGVRAKLGYNTASLHMTWPLSDRRSGLCLVILLRTPNGLIVTVLRNIAVSKSLYEDL